jgi:hypothetical protein
VERRDHGEAADELGDQPELEDVLGLDLVEQLPELQIVEVAAVVLEADGLAVRPGAR